MFCALLGKISGERLQDHWSSGLVKMLITLETRGLIGSNSVC